MSEPEDRSHEPDLFRLKAASDAIATNPEWALGELMALAEQGSVLSMIHLGCSFRDGLGGKVDTIQATRWFERAKDCGSLLGSFYLGSLYWRLEDYDKAEVELSSSADKDYMQSIYWLGRFYIYGPEGRRDVAKGLNFLRKGAKMGHIFAKRDLGSLLMGGAEGMFGRVNGLLIFISGIMEARRTAARDPSSQRLRSDGAY